LREATICHTLKCFRDIAEMFLKPEKDIGNIYEHTCA
jgi:hypothetical protein